MERKTIVRVLIAGLGVLLPLLAGAAINDDVMRAMQDCNAKAESFEQQHYCMLKSSPRKCRKLLRGLPQRTASVSIRQKWLGCVSTCEGATLYSRTFGECSTPSDPNR